MLERIASILTSSRYSNPANMALSYDKLPVRVISIGSIASCPKVGAKGVVTAGFPLLEC